MGMNNSREIEMKTLSFAGLAYYNKKKKTRWEKFLEEMDKVIPWEEMTEAIRPYYPKAGSGRLKSLLSFAGFLRSLTRASVT
jgi:hypothetical protein